MSTEVRDRETREVARRHVEAERPRLEFGGAWEYSPAPESKDHVRIEKRYGLFIGGEFVAPKTKKEFRTIKPPTPERLSQGAEGGPEDVDAAGPAGEEAPPQRPAEL